MQPEEMTPKTAATNRTEHVKRLIVRLNHRLERYLPEQRLFLRSDNSTRYVRLRPVTQAVTCGSLTLFFGWAVVATSILLMDTIGSGNLREQAQREQANFERRLDQLASERDARALETEAAQARFSEAMARVSDMQMQLLASEQRRLELETGIETIQATLQSAVAERDAARQELAEATTTLAETTGSRRTAAERGREAEDMLASIMAAMDRVTQARHDTEIEAEQITQLARHLSMENELIKDRNQRIFNQIEDALEQVIDPLERVFRSAGVSPDQIRRAVRSGAAPQTDALRPIAISTSGSLPDGDLGRANAVIDRLSQVYAYRLGAERLPISRPVTANVRETSGFGMRRHPLTGRSTMHNGLDWAGSRGTSIFATADGVVKKAGRQGGYGNLVIIQHDFGIETYYAHLNSIDVRVGQRVSRGQKIGGMGTTGASTGVHLHYEVRANGRPVNPSTYVRAGQNVF